MGAVADRHDHLRNFVVTLVTCCFGDTESGFESTWGVQCLRAECIRVERVSERVMIQRHSAGTKPSVVRHTLLSWPITSATEALGLDKMEMVWYTIEIRPSS